MSAPADTAGLRYLEPEQTKIRGERCDGMTIRTADGHALGRVQGFLVDPTTRRLRYFVVRKSGPLGLGGDSRIVPITSARVNLDDRAIELLDEDDEFEAAGRFSRNSFPAFTDEDFLTAIFAPQR